MALEDAISGPARQLSYWVLRGEGGAPTAFYHELVHGPKLLPRLEWDMPDSIYESPKARWEYDPNPDCLIPEGAEPMTDAEYAEYFPSEEP